MMRADMTLRTNPGPFRAVWRGEKTAELRLNDREFQVGDTIEMIEFDPQAGHWIPPHRRVYIRVTHVLPGGQFGMLPDWCMLSFKVLRREIGLRGAKWARCGMCKKQTPEIS